MILQALGGEVRRRRVSTNLTQEALRRIRVGDSSKVVGKLERVIVQTRG